MICQMCQGKVFLRVAVYQDRPPGEIIFPFSELYRRRLMRCETCGHFVNLFPMSLEHLYSYDYVQATYGGEEGIVPAFGRIMALLPEESDNFGLVWAIHQFLREHQEKENGKTNA